MIATLPEQYKVVNGTSYHVLTPDAVVQILEQARKNGTYVKLHLGETDNDRGSIGKDWLEENEVHGTVGRSTGSVKVPLLLATPRSTGGGAILDHCIVRIRIGSTTVYQHPKYHTGKIELQHKNTPVTVKVGKKDLTLTVDALRDGQHHASFKDMEAARKWAKKLGIESAPITN